MPISFLIMAHLPIFFRDARQKRPQVAAETQRNTVNQITNTAMATAAMRNFSHIALG